MKKLKIYIVILLFVALYLWYLNKQKLEDTSTTETSTKRLPQALIIGARKGGTRALINSLALHSKIKVAKREVHYFDDENLYQNGLEWYRNQMPKSAIDQITIEKTPAYFPSPKVPKRVFEVDPNIKIILIIRNPVDRTISDFSQVQATRTSKNLPLLDFKSSVFLPNSTDLNLKFKPVFNSLYDLHLQNWLEYFGLDQILIVDGDKFKQDPLSEIRNVERFLKLEPEITSANIRFNEKKGFYCFVDNKQHEKCLGENKGRPQVFVSQRVRRLLSNNFNQYNEKFFQLINQRFYWKK
ncbi:unnamed protein product [Bursaphelenchus okinawaensis]|uniref:Sulfotransferase domain-containing protein n=1 Tax=Bursaphelenchus okinawaensis TaxID=465554 RepID=A0A811K8C2_9BILA|nr:unnamed protein product [Bursaphelenchus okinawaensis]CAG9095761.1 unnamed protein product [Bursaphelenchus okinawaensis]